MATARSGYTLQVIKAGQQGHVEMRWGHLADVDTRAAAAAIMQHIQRFCQPEKLSVYARYTRRGGLDINPWRTNTDFVPATGRLVRQ